MKRTLPWFVGSVVVLMVADCALACDMCAIYRSEELGNKTTGLSLGVAEQFTHFGAMQEDGTKVNNEADQNLDSSITQLILSYQLTSRFGLQVDIPLIHRSFRRPEGATMDQGTESGLGDVSVLAYGSVYEFMDLDTTFIWNVLGGIKLPTGSPDRLNEELSEVEPFPGMPESGVHGHDLTLGSGSFDGVVGTGFALRWKRLICSGAAEYFIRSEGHIDYQCADELDWNVKPGAYLWLTEDSTCSIRCAVHGENKGKDTFQGESAVDTGMDALLMGPEIDVTWQNTLSTSLGMDFPVDIDNTALQLVPDYKIYAALTWRL